jgi:cullin-associated NEDD8-dissociated protein 1
MPHLEKHAADDMEGVRAMVAECLGSLTCMQPTLMLDKLSKLVEDHSGIVAEGGKVDPADVSSKKNCNVLWTVASSIKHAITGKVDQLAAYMPNFVKLLKQEELSVRNAALLMVYSSVHHMPQLVSGLFKDQISPSLYEVAGLTMKRKVDLGPFSHTVDDALPLRKATFSIFAKCLENPILTPTMDMAVFIPALIKALGDVEDIQLQAHQIVLGMCLRQPTYVVASIETFVEPLEKTLFKKAGQKTGTELERLQDWIKSALRTMVALSKVDGSMNSRKFAEFVERTRANSKFRVQLDAVDEELHV